MTKSRAWGVSIPLIFIVVIAIGWFAVLSPQRSHASALVKSATTEQQTSAQLQGQIDVLKKQQAQVPSEKARIAQISQEVPPNPSLPSYVRFLTQAAATTHVELISMAPTVPAVVQVAARPGAASGAATAQPAQPAALSGIAVSLTVTGDYFAIQQFLAQLEKSPRATVVSSVSLAPGQALAPQSTSGSSSAPKPAWETLQATISATIFETAAPATTGTAPATTGTSAAPSPPPASTATPAAAAQK